MRRRQACSNALAAALFLAPLGVPRAQLPTTTPTVFLEKAYFSLGTPSGKGLLFEGQPTVHYYIRNHLSDQTWQANGGFQWTLPVSAVFQVRMLDTTSEPVRTPSYRIRPLFTQLLWLSRPANRFEYRLFGVSAGFTHYSNGQAGCTYRGYSRNEQQKCAVSNPLLAEPRVTNTLDGDFSTSYWSLGANWRQGWQPGNSLPMTWQYTIHIEGQLHPYDIRPGGMNRELAATWGQHQWSGGVEVERRHGIAPRLRRLLGPSAVSRFATQLEQRFGGPEFVRLTRWQIELSSVADSTNSLGVFVRYHHGFDYYNIQYQNRHPFLAVGVMWDLGRLDALNTRSRH